MPLFGPAKITKSPTPDFIGYVYSADFAFTDAEVAISWLSLNDAGTGLRPLMRTLLTPTLFHRLGALFVSTAARYAGRFGPIRIARETPERAESSSAVQTRFANVTFLHHTQYDLTLDLWFQLTPQNGRVQVHAPTRLIFVPARFAPLASAMQSAVDAFTKKYGSPEGRK